MRKIFDSFVGVDGVLVSSAANIKYCCSIAPDDAYALLTENKTYLITDGRFSEVCSLTNSELSIVIAEKGRSHLDTAIDLLAVLKIGRLGIEENNICAKDYHRLSQITNTVFVSSVFSTLRRNKNAEEILLIKKAQTIAEQAFTKTINWLKEGVSEIDVARYLEQSIYDLDGNGTSFPTIVAFGEHTSLPHAVPSKKRLANGDIITIDMGVNFEGYCSDMTRTFGFGKLSSEQKSIYSLVLEGQNEAIRKATVGCPCASLDRAARNIFALRGYAENFVHSLGHGVGLDVHEEPRLSASSTDVLMEGDVVTIEPGLYFPSHFGIRIEDMLFLGKNGVENLTSITKKLIIV